MWVLHICHCYYPPFLDCARQYNQLFKNTEYKVLTVYLTGEASTEVEQETDADEVIFLGYKSKQVSGLKLAAISQIKKITAERDFKFCITHRAKPTYVALLATKLPIISVRHNYGDFKRFSRRILVNLYRKRLLILGVSNSVRDEIRQSLPHWPQDQIQTLYNRIDVNKAQSDLVSKSEARDTLKLPSDAWMIANVGRLHHDKDQTTLIKGFAKAYPSLPKNSLLVIIGSGPLENDLKNLVSNLNISNQVIFTGQVKNARNLFKAFDVFALTSDKEPFGMVLLEAMAAELPIICSDCGGGREIVHDIGQLFEYQNTNELSECMMHIASQKDLDNNAASTLKLQEKFSDQAAHQAFWKLSFLQEIQAKIE